MPLILLLTLFSAFSFASEETEALRAVRLGCDKQKVALGCYNYANFLLKSGDSSAADSYFEKGCGLGHEPSCKKEEWETKPTSSDTQEKNDNTKSEVTSPVRNDEEENRESDQLPEM